MSGTIQGNLRGPFAQIVGKVSAMTAFTIHQLH